MSNIAAQQKDHPGVVALIARIDAARQGIGYWERAAQSHAEEAKIQDEINALHERLSLIRRHREESAATLETKNAEITRLENLLVMCRANSDVAQAIWMKLMLDRKRPK